MIDPTAGSAVKNLARIDKAMGKEEQAKNTLIAYLDSSPEDRQARAMLSELVVLTADSAEAQQQLEALLEQEPGNTSVRAQLVKLHFDQASYARVLELTDALQDEAVVEQSILIELRGKSLINLGQPEQAMDTWRRWLQLAPNSVLGKTTIIRIPS